ncbi:hypothetical protein Dvina_40055 [Dactylosporangium vinaceum]|uniref:DNA recombination-mediator protein A n=1 Tax=Dactylosporangium vinaceum TaxID=53362 RepID=A0ABV5M845_9ACTN|nr:hypothetical protein [Dactylosporangium vinaceum]UAB94297.1 hypothetical protein Dvina_40055 [Dactylosporangium vinaceum]
MRVGITGHTNLTNGTAAAIYSALVAELLTAGPGLIGVTCLAHGADQLFAHAVNEVGGAYEVILPAPDYRRVVPLDRRDDYDTLLSRASRVVPTGERRAGRRAYVAANRIMLSRVDRLLAVWDGHDHGTPGGTADVVTQAREADLPLKVIWPAGAERA